MWAEHVLKRWHKDIEQAESEGKQYEHYASIYLPKARHADSGAFWNGWLWQVNKTLCCAERKKGEEITSQIISSTQIADCIWVVAYYLAKDSEDSDSNSKDKSTTSESIVGTAVKDAARPWACQQSWWCRGGQAPELAGASMDDLAGKNDDTGNNSYLILIDKKLLFKLILALSMVYFAINKVLISFQELSSLEVKEISNAFAFFPSVVLFDKLLWSACQHSIKGIWMEAFFAIWSLKLSETIKSIKQVVLSNFDSKNLGAAEACVLVCLTSLHSTPEVHILPQSKNHHSIDHLDKAQVLVQSHLMLFLGCM